MKSIISLGLIALIFSIGAAKADTTTVSSATFEYSHSDIKFDTGLKQKFDGSAIGFGSDPREQYGYWGKLELSQNSKSDSEYYEGTIGVHYNLFARDGFYLNGLAGIGYTRIDSGITSSNLNFISVPVGIEAGYSVAKNLDLFANVGIMNGYSNSQHGIMLADACYYSESSEGMINENKSYRVYTNEELITETKHHQPVS